MKRRWKLFIAVAVVMLVLMGIWVVTMCIEPSDELEAYKKSLIAKGEKLEIAELIPPPVPPEQNGADIVNKAAKLIVGLKVEDYNTNVPIAMRQIAPARAVVGFEQQDIRADFFTNSWVNVLAVVESNRAPAEILKQIMDYPKFDFHVDYTNVEDTDLGLEDIDSCAQLLSAVAVCDLHEGNISSATTNICVLLDLVNDEQYERTTVAQGDRVFLISLALSASWELLQSSNLDDVELAKLQRNWERLEFIHAVENALLMARADMEIAIQKARNSDEFFQAHMSIPIPPPVSPITPSVSLSWDEKLDNLLYKPREMYAKVMWRTSWSYPDELQMLRDFQFVLETVRTMETNGFFDPACTNMANRLSSSSEPNDWVNKLRIPDLRSFFSDEGKGAEDVILQARLCEAAKRLVITAIALKRYQLKHGTYPASLNFLAPEFVSTAPLDPADGKLLRYRPNADDTFLLYAIGFDGVDHGGTASVENWMDPTVLDWVWPQPATEAEIEYFYAHLPK